MSKKYMKNIKSITMDGIQLKSNTTENMGAVKRDLRHILVNIRKRKYNKKESFLIVKSMIMFSAFLPTVELFREFWRKYIHKLDHEPEFQKYFADYLSHGEWFSGVLEDGFSTYASQSLERFWQTLKETCGKSLCHKDVKDVINDIDDALKAMSFDTGDLQGLDDKLITGPGKLSNRDPLTSKQYRRLTSQKLESYYKNKNIYNKDSRYGILYIIAKSKLEETESELSKLYDIIQRSQLPESLAETYQIFNKYVILFGNNMACSCSEYCVHNECEHSIYMNCRMSGIDTKTILNKKKGRKPVAPDAWTTQEKMDEENEKKRRKRDGIRQNAIKMMLL